MYITELRDKINNGTMTDEDKMAVQLISWGTIALAAVGAATIIKSVFKTNRYPYS